MTLADQSFVIDSAIEKGRPLPDWYEEEPYIHPEDQFFLSAFSDLTTCRTIGMDVGTIPWTAIIKYAHYAELDRDLIKPFINIIQMMDKRFLEYIAKKKGSN